VRHLRIGGVGIDAAVSQAFLAALTGDTPAACLTAARQLHDGHDSALEQYRRQVTQARYDATKAEMPPVPAWSRGVEQYRDFMAHLFAVRADWATRLVAAGGEPDLLLYTVEGGRRVPHTVQLFTADENGAIDHVLVYRDDRLFALSEQQCSPPR